MEPTEPFGGIKSSPHTAQKRVDIRVVLIVALVALLLVGLIIFLVLHYSRAKPAATTQGSSTTLQTSTTEPAPDTVTDSSMTTYTANGQDIKLSFSYPASWTATPASGTDTTDAAVTLTSPAVSLTDASGTVHTGKIVMSIRPGGATMSELGSGQATIAQNSIQIAYAKPTSAQHQYPYVTFVHLSGGSNPNSAFEELFITGAATFSKNQSITADGLSQLDPIISARFYTCATAACPISDNVALGIGNTGWTNDVANQQLLAIFESLQIN